MAAGSLEYLEQAVSLASQEFIKGFVAGQLVLILCLVFLFKYFLLRNSFETRTERSILGTRRTQIRLSNAILGTNEEPSETDAFDWLNAAFGHVIRQYFSQPQLIEQIVSSMKEKLNGAIDGHSYMDRIELTEVSFTQIIPKISNPRLQRGFREAEAVAELEIEANLAFEEGSMLSATLETSVLFNWPAAAIASLPIVATISLCNLEGTLHLLLKDLAVEYFLSDLKLAVKVNSLVGHKTKLKDVPKISEFVERKIEQHLQDALCKRHFVCIKQMFSTQQ